jgi:FkbH-like protein
MSALCKCVIWDLDNTIWDGICLEGKISPRPEIRDTIATLHQRGILHSIASRGEEEIAMRALRDQKLLDFFLVPKINWLPKTTNILQISRELNISLDALTFVDDDPFEREQVAFMLPDVLTVAAECAMRLQDRPEFNPGPLSAEAQARKEFYETEEFRKKVASEFSSREEFLSSCRMELSVRRMVRDDIPRVLELMTRTHQLNTTGIMLEREELDNILYGAAGRHAVFVAELRDRFGCYGIIGIALASLVDTQWTFPLFALSCRVLGRGIERAFLAFLVNQGKQHGCACIEALYKPTGRNRMLRALFQMSGFEHRCESPDGTMIFALQSDDKVTVPHWVSMR